MLPVTEPLPCWIAELRNVCYQYKLVDTSAHVVNLFRYAPTDVVEAIYGGVSGAAYDSSLGQWVVPCESEIDMALQFGFVDIIHSYLCSV